MKKKFFLLFLLSVLFFGHLNTIGQNNTSVLPNTFIVKLKPEYRNLFTQKSILNLSDSNISISPTFPQHKPLLHKANENMVDLSLIYTITTTDELFIQKMLKTNYFDYVQPKYVHQNFYTPNDEKIGNQWHLNTIQAYEAWDICRGDSNVVIGISDSGIDTNIFDLTANIKYNYNDPIDGIDNDNDGFIDNFYGWNIADNNYDVSYTIIHGIFVSAISSSKTDNNSALAGVGFNCKFLPIKNQNATWGITAGYESIVYAADHGCQIINCSWGSIGSHDQFGQDIINYATFNRGALVIAAAGNTNALLPFYPAAYDNVLSVAATNISDEKADFSTYDYSVDISAPGKAIYSCLGSSFGQSDGTSFSAPIVAGVAALIKSYFPHFTPQQIIHRLKTTADNIDTIAGNSQYAGLLGSGRVNAYRALSDPMRPSLEITNIQYNTSEKKLNDTIRIFGEITNFLAEANHAIVKASIINNNADLLYDSIYIGQLSSLQTTDNKELFCIQLSSEITASTSIVVRFDFYDSTSFLGFQYLPIKLSNNITMNINDQICTITDCGRLGYDDIYCQFGQGIKNTYQSESLLSFGTFLFATNSTYVSDNIASNNVDKEMINILPPYIVSENKLSDMQINTIFNDDGAGNTKLNIETHHTAMAWQESPLEKTIIHQFSMINKNDYEINNLYAGLFMDWDIGISNANRILYDENNRMTYTLPILNGSYAAIKFLSNINTKVYAFDNDGSNLSMKINEGFTDLQKYNAMTTNRFEAGTDKNGNDVSTMATYGPIHIANKDTATIAFAIILGNNLRELQKAAIAAQQKYNTLQNDSINDNFIIDKKLNHLHIFPNPCKNQINISSKKDIILNINIFDKIGKLVLSKNHIDDYSQTINIETLSKGIYILQITTPTTTIVKKICKQ